MDSQETPNAPTLGERLKEEFTKYLLISVYLFLCFSTLLLYKSALLLEYEAHYLPFSLALVKALVLGKFILIGDALKVGQRQVGRVLWHRILWKSVAFLGLLILFTCLEELIVGWFHGQTLAATVEEFSGRPWLSVIAPSLVMLLILIPLIATREIDRLLGTGTLSALLRHEDHQHASTE